MNAIDPIRGKRRILLYALFLVGVLYALSWMFPFVIGELDEASFPWHGVLFIALGVWFLYE